jgi:hypothetical protein
MLPSLLEAAVMAENIVSPKQVKSTRCETCQETIWFCFCDLEAGEDE